MFFRKEKGGTGKTAVDGAAWGKNSVGLREKILRVIAVDKQIEGLHRKSLGATCSLWATGWGSVF